MRKLLKRQGLLPTSTSLAGIGPTMPRFGPGAIRSQSVMLRPVNPHRSNINVFETLKVVDVGDSMIVPGYLERTMVYIDEAIGRIADTGAIPLSLGGDHSVTLPELRALARRSGPLALVHWDSHTDTWESYFDGQKYSAGTPFRRAVEEGLIEPANSIQIGMRGTLFRDSDILQSIDLGFDVVTTDEALALGPTALADRVRERVANRPAFLTFDMDFVDPASAPGVQTPEAGGPTAREAHSIILGNGNTLVFQRNFFCARARTVSPIRQKSVLLISKGNFADSEFARFQPLSASIGRFSTSSASIALSARR